MSMHIAKGDDDTDSFSIYSIPDRMLEQFNRIGGDFHYFTTLDGARIAVCDSIDFIEWKIKTPWFAELSNFEFFRSKNSFLKLQDMYVDEVRTNSKYRSMHSVLVFKRVAEELQKHYNKFDKVMLEPESDIDEDLNKLIQEGINEYVNRGTGI